MQRCDLCGPAQWARWQANDRIQSEEICVVGSVTIRVGVAWEVAVCELIHY